MAKGKYEEWLEPDKLILLEGWARDGLTDEQIAHNMGINRRTLTDWKNKYPPISLTLKSGKEVIDRQVENALLKNALGFHYREEQLSNKGEVVEIERYEKPNTTAQIFWLKNRKSAVWRDKQEHSVDGDIGINVVVDYGDTPEG